MRDLRKLGGLILVDRAGDSWCLGGDGGSSSAKFTEKDCKSSLTALPLAFLGIADLHLDLASED